MKYIVFWDLDPKDFDITIEKFIEVQVEREKGSNKFPKYLYPPHSMGGQFKGFSLYESVTPEQMINMTLHYMPVMNLKFVPIEESIKSIEAYQKMK